MKKEHLFVAAIAVFAFWACSNENNSSSDKGGCLLKIDGVNQTCMEANQYYSKQSCVSPSEWVSDCPSGGSKCDQNYGTFTVVTHYYNAGVDLCTGSLSSSSSLVSSSSSSSVPGSGSEGVCYVTNMLPDTDLAACAKAEGESMTSSDCAEMAEETGYTVVLRASCPASQVLTCPQEGGILYLYGTFIGIFGFTCEDFEEEE